VTMATAEQLRERLANIDALERDGKIQPGSAVALRQQADEMLRQLEGPQPTVETGEVVDKLKSMELRPFLGLEGVNKPEELKPRASRETTKEPSQKRPQEAQNPPTTPSRGKSDLERQVDRENAIVASILAKARYSDVLAKPGPGMIKPNDMRDMFGVNVPAQEGLLSMGIPRNALTDEEMEFLMDRNARMKGGT
jgi:hypothetical protein